MTMKGQFVLVDPNDPDYIEDGEEQKAILDEKEMDSAEAVARNIVLRLSGLDYRWIRKVSLTENQE